MEVFLLIKVMKLHLKPSNYWQKIYTTHKVFEFLWVI